MRLSALKPKLDPSLDLFADVILHPSFPEADFKREQKLQLDAIQQEQSEPIPDGPAGLPRPPLRARPCLWQSATGSGTAASVQKITRDDLMKFHESWFRPNNATLVVAGDTTLAELTPKLEKLFAGWKPGEIPVKNISAVQLRAQTHRLHRGQARRRPIGDPCRTRGAPPNTPEEIAIQAMNDDLGGTFSSRLNMNLREDKHWAYGAGSFLWGARAQRPFIVYAPVQTDKTKESLMKSTRN